MLDKELFLKELIKKANMNNNLEVLNKINDSKFIKSLNEISDVLNELGYSLEDINSDKGAIEYQNTIKENLTYTNIALSLCRDYFAVYYVDITTDDYEQYDVDNENQTIRKIEEGKDFFYVSTINAKKFIYKEDLDRFLYTLKKENIIKELSINKSHDIVYRQLINGIPTYVSLKIINLSNDDNHIVFAVCNIDDFKRKENEFNQKYEKERIFARTDSLTNCYNRNYFNEVEEDVNHKIESGTVKEFSAVVCDINNLKIINDTYGHDVGDKFILEAKNIISNTFKESLLFRVGGDEFIVLLSGNDYKNRIKLLNKIKDTNNENKDNNKVVIACGYSDFNPNKDKNLNDILKRADISMYKNKKELKA